MLNIVKSGQFSVNPDSVYIENTDDADYAVWFYNVSQCNVILRPKFELVDRVRTFTGDYLLSINGVVFEGNIEQTAIDGSPQTGETYINFSRALEAVFTNAN
jgi:hypothetical protein